MAGAIQTAVHVSACTQSCQVDWLMGKPTHISASSRIKLPTVIHRGYDCHSHCRTTDGVEPSNRMTIDDRVSTTGEKWRCVKRVSPGGAQHHTSLGTYRDARERPNLFEATYLLTKPTQYFNYCRMLRQGSRPNTEHLSLWGTSYT